MTYLNIYGALLLSGLLAIGRPNGRSAFFVIWLVLLFSFVAFRYEVGCDWQGYEEHFEETRYLSSSEVLARREQGYWSSLIGVHAAGLEYPYINVLLAIPFFWGLAHLARQQPDPLGFLILSFPVLIINMPMSAIRQSAAIGFICLGFVAFNNRRLKQYVLFIVAASLFHMSALIFVAMAPFIKYRLSRSTIALAVVLVLPGAYFMLSDTFSLYTDRYVDTSIEAAGAIYRSGMLAATAALFFVMLRRPFQERFPAEYKLVWIGACMMLATLPATFISSVISDRFGYYVTPIQLIILARIPYLVKGPSAALLSVSPYAALGAVLAVWTTYSFHFQKCYVPYQTWLSWKY